MIGGQEASVSLGIRKCVKKSDFVSSESAKSGNRGLLTKFWLRCQHPARGEGRAMAGDQPVGR